MANPKRPTSGTPPRQAAPNRTPWFIGGAVVLVIVIAAIIAIVATGGDDDSSDEPREPGTSTTTGDVVLPTLPDRTTVPDDSVGPDPSVDPELSREPTSPAELQPVQIVGDALSQLDGSDDPEVGAPAPGIEGYGFDGTPVSITPGDGQPTLVVFVAHWCPHCNREVPRLIDWRDEGRVPADLRVVAVSTSANEAAPNWPPSEWLADEDWQWPVIADTEDQLAAAAYGLPGYPYFVLIGADGTVVHRQSGEVPVAELEAILADAGIQ